MKMALMLGALISLLSACESLNWQKAAESWCRNHPDCECNSADCERDRTLYGRFK